MVLDLDDDGQQVRDIYVGAPLGSARPAQSNSLQCFGGGT
jgi:hypothetical protein